LNSRLLELWGQTLVDAAKAYKESNAFFEVFRDGYAAPSKAAKFAELCGNAFGKDGIESFNAVMKEFYDNAGVVPRTEYNELHDRYIELLEKNQQLEKTIRELRNRFEDEDHPAAHIVGKWSEAAEKYAEINKQFFDEFSKFFR
jgi:hypothetical protein